MLYSTAGLSQKQLEVRELALSDLEAFIRLVAPYQVLGHCHIDLCKWLRVHESENKLLLWPRDHGKSRYAAFYAAWSIVKDPAITIIYGSATAEKAEEQLRFVKEILTSEVVFRYFPGLIETQEGKRKAWNITNIIIDHPYRTSQGVVDATVMTCGLEKTITGKHCKKFIWDDIVVPENNTEEGRRQVNTWVSYAASVMSADSDILAVGTRYHPKDAYNLIMDMLVDENVEDESGNIVKEQKPLFVVKMANVEVDGQFLWPRTQRLADNKWFGFNENILARKRAVYEASGNIVQFFAQYYNDPNDKSTSPISREQFKYYDRATAERFGGVWHVANTPVRIYAAIDLAASIKEKADYTAVTIGGIDSKSVRYLMEAVRYRTDKISITMKVLKELYMKYQFQKLRIEAVGGFKLVAQDLADQLSDAGIRIPIDIYVPPNREAKEVRIKNILEPLYQSQSIYHYRGGACQYLEDELCMSNPAHDDLKDCWAMCCDLMEKQIDRRKLVHSTPGVVYHPRFGGIAV